MQEKHSVPSQGILFLAYLKKGIVFSSPRVDVDAVSDCDPSSVEACERLVAVLSVIFYRSNCGVNSLSFFGTC